MPRDKKKAFRKVEQKKRHLKENLYFIFFEYVITINFPIKLCHV